LNEIQPSLRKGHARLARMTTITAGPTSPLLLLSATELARRIRAREQSAREVLEAHLAHVARFDGVLNAVVVKRFDEARAEADAADARIARAGADELLPPLLGVPCTIKESIGIAGLPQSAGLVARANRLLEEEPTTVARLRAAGAIPIGLTNVSELCMWMEADNRVYGRTSCAYDAARTCGGSSGGEGAAVGAGGVPFGLGADVGGSIRIPAFFNGVFGHKPTGGLVPATGQYPCAENEALRYLTTGPLARRAEDLGPLLRILAGPDGRDGIAMDWGDEREVDVARLTVLDVREPVAMAASDDLEAAREKAVATLARRGARVKKVALPALREGLQIWSAMMEAAGGKTFAELLGDGREVSAAYELLRWSVRRSPYTLPAIALALLEKVPKLLGSSSARYVARGQALRAELDAALGDDGVMPFPPHACVVTKHGHALLPPVRWAYTAIFNVMETPSTAVPMGLDAEALPLGVQVVGPRGRDALPLAVARVLEDAHGGWVPPPLWFAR
jgi:fatty acid amide hydrolase 2